MYKSFQQSYSMSPAYYLWMHCESEDAQWDFSYLKSAAGKMCSVDAYVMSPPAEALKAMVTAKPSNVDPSRTRRYPSAKCWCFCQTTKTPSYPRLIQYAILGFPF